MEVIEDFAKEGTVYLELRIGLKPVPTKREYLETLLSAIGEAALLHPYCTVKLLLSVARDTPVSYAREQVVLAIEHVRTHQPDPVVVGVEMGGSPYAGSWRELRCLFDAAREAGLRVSLHCGERPDAQEEWSEMLTWRPDRVGHGTFLSEENLSRLSARAIPVEFCVSVAERFFCQKSAKMILSRLPLHPHIVCTDNTTLNETTLTAEYEKVMKDFLLTPKDLLVMSWRAIDFAFASSIAKEKVRKDFVERLSLSFRHLSTDVISHKYLFASKL